VDLVDEDDRPAAARPPPEFRGGHHLFDLLDTGQHRAERHEVRLRHLRNDPRQRRLAGAWRAPEDDRLQQITLDRFGQKIFDPVVGVDHVTHPKPHPEGLHKIRAKVSHRKVWYLGDTVDDARAASAAGVPFIGIAAPAAPRHEELVQLLREEGAVAVLDDINSLEDALAPHR